MNFEGQIALVTGASRGIGASIAGRLAARGATVVGTATAQAGIESMRQAVPGVDARILDIADRESVANLFAALASDARLPSILVNNAGITRDGLLIRMSEDDWDSVVNTNLTSLYRMCKASLRHLMRARRGRIINVGSVVGATGNAGQVNYAAAKSGLVGFTRSLAREVGSRGITVNAVAPGFIDTDMTRGLADEQRARLVAQVPLGRLGAADDVAEAVCFLASESAAYITGETLHVNGGMYMG